MILKASVTKQWFGGRLLSPEDRLESRGKYFPYGEERTNITPANPSNDQEKFAAYTRDSATGLDYAGQRYFNNFIARFMQPDPYGASGQVTIPQSWNRYAYVGNDPINSNDPSGLCGMSTDFISGWFSGCADESNSWGYDLVDSTIGGSVQVDDSFLPVQTVSTPSVTPQGSVFTDSTNQVYPSCGTAEACNSLNEGIAYPNPVPGVGNVPSDSSPLIPFVAAAQSGAVFTVMVIDVGEGTAGSIAKDVAPEVPSFLGQESGPAIPIPEGAQGPFTTRQPGVQYVGGNGGNGLAQGVTDVRIMDPTPPNARYPYPKGYATYSSGSQGVNPYTGIPIRNSDPFRHLPLGR